MPNSPAEARLEFKNNCGVCGTPLVYQTEPVTRSCVFCRQTYSTQIYCPAGHYICDSCHSREAIEVLKQVLGSSTSTSPLEIMELVMQHPAVPMHGPEHHVILPAAIVTAVRNAGYSVPQEALEITLTRGAKVPGGWCGYFGACGAGIGVGIAVSALTGATPLTGKTRSLANEATSFALARIADGYPRCCKRAGRQALAAAIEFLRDKLDIVIDPTRPSRCIYYQRNRECPKEECPYYSAPLNNTARG